MHRYRDTWFTGVAAAAALGVCVAVLTWPLQGVVSAFVAGAVIGGLMVGAFAPDGGRRYRPALGAVAVGMALVAVGGLLALLQGAALPVLVAAALSSPPAVRWSRRKLRRRGTGPAAATPHGHLPDAATARTEPPVSVPAVDTAVLPCPKDLDDGTLCWAWRRSYVVLQRSTAPATRLLVVQIRQTYLDEFELRNPSALAAWLASGARAAGNPGPFMLHGDRTSPPR